MKRILVIGAASGLGRLWAQRLLAEGHAVVVADRHRPAFDHPQAEAVTCDITEQADVDAVLAQGPFDSVVLTAAIMPTSPALDDSPEQIRQIMEVNYFGALRVLHAALPPMVAQNSGEVIVFGSVAGEVPTPHMSAYSASKAALAMYIETLQMELTGTQVSVRIVLPPITDTPLLEQARTTSNPRSFEVGREQGIVARPEDVVSGALRAVRRGKLRIYPHRMARALHFARRWMPRLLSHLVLKSERG